MNRGFHVTHPKKSAFKRRGLRSYFEYRDLGIKRATRGRVVAHVIRHSKNLEMIEVVAPAVFKTYSAAKPAARKSPARRSRG
jgi:hypothetical protein